MKQTMRSSWPRVRVLRATLATLAAAGLLYGAWFGFWRYHLKRLTPVREGVLYRVAQPTEFGCDYLVHRLGVKTILSLQLYDPHLRRGYYDPGEPDGVRETAYVASLGTRHVQWAMGREVCWPWVTPWQYDEFFKLFDNPENFPIAVHCAGGRHRTGTVSALFRLEYDRWPIDRVLTEMYSFKFGGKSLLQEYNLRAYRPRPLPDEKARLELERAFSELFSEPPELMSVGCYAYVMPSSRPNLFERLEGYVVDDRPFALPLAQRLIDLPGNPAAAAATELAAKRIGANEGSSDDWYAAASLIADFGDPSQQEALLDVLKSERNASDVTERYSSLVAGVENRYTENRLPYWQAILEDERPCIEPALADKRYCDVAVIKMSAALDKPLLVYDPVSTWEHARHLARQWFAEHPAAQQLRQLVPPTGNNPVMPSEGAIEEDLSRLEGQSEE